MKISVANAGAFGETAVIAVVCGELCFFQAGVKGLGANVYKL